MKKDYVWCDINGNKYTLEQIDDRYLLNILSFINKGGGYTDFMSDSKITKLFKEANKRMLKHNLKLNQLKEAYHEKLSWVCQTEDWWNYMSD
jgi:hypothetical protein